jgi:hypothetical protein
MFLSRITQQPLPMQREKNSASKKVQFFIYSARALQATAINRFFSSCTLRHGVCPKARTVTTFLLSSIE